MAAQRKARPAPRIVTVAGGKGGVGKSTVAANLAVAIGRLGQRAVLVDGDLGAANLHTMLGAVSPSAGLAELLDHRVDSLDEVSVPVAPSVRLVPGTTRPGAANLPSAQKLRLLRGIARIDADCVVVDVGAGTSYHVVDLIAIADVKLFVLAPQLPALHNGYALVKACVHRIVRRLARLPRDRGEERDGVTASLIDAALAAEGRARTIPQLLSVLRPLDAALADGIVDTLLRFGAGIVGNLVASEAEVHALGRMGPLFYDHLLVHAPLLTVVRRTAALAGGLRAGSGTVAGRGDDCASAFRTLAAAVLGADLARLRGEQRPGHEHTLPLWITRDVDGRGPT